MKTFASLFTGGDGAGIGAKSAGLEPIWGLEIDPKIAAIAEQNLGHKVYCQDILDSDPSNFDSPDWLHASPVCKAFSSANANKGEKDWDIKCGHKVAEFIEVLQPRYFSLENVWAYRNSRSFQIIVEALNANGYNCQSEIINATDHGVPQSRERLFLIAYKGDLRWFWNPFTSNAKRMGWYEAIADFFPVPADAVTRIEPCHLEGLDKKTIHAIAMGATVAVETIGRRSDRKPLVAYGNEPIWTIRALSDEHWWKFRWFHRGFTGLSTIEMAARLQGFPDSYQWLGHRATDGTIIGNSVCPPVMQKLIENTINWKS